MRSGGLAMATVRTQFGSLERFEKGGVDVINDDPRHYAFSNVYEVALRSAPYEKIAVAKNLKYVLEAIRAEGTSPWYAAAHDEAAIVMDGEIEIRLLKLDNPVADGLEGTTMLEGNPRGRAMGRIVARRGHMVLLPKGAAYQFHAARTGVILLQTMRGELTIERWSDICQK
jgi:quercetin dioxygenase-like cupin family protein